MHDVKENNEQKTINLEVTTNGSFQFSESQLESAKPYIVYKRFKSKAWCGDINIPAMAECVAIDNVIVYNNLPICYTTSENAHQHFARNDDEQGMKRGKLISSIQKKLAKRDDNYQKRWDKIWEDPICQKFKREQHEDHWLWNHDFFNAHIFDLNYIANLIDAKI